MSEAPDAPRAPEGKPPVETPPVVTTPVVTPVRVVIADALRVCVRHLRRPALSTLSEAPYVESKILAPAGLIPTRKEREEARDAVTPTGV